MTDSTIVVPWDFSRHSQAALEFALQNFTAKNIHVICVLEPPSIYDPGMNWDEESKALAKEKCRQEFEQFAQFAKDTELEFKAHFGDPAAEIVRFAEDVKADFVVISTHGRTGIKGFFLGSVAKKVAQYSSCPILMLPNGWFEQHSADTRERTGTAQ